MATVNVTCSRFVTPFASLNGIRTRDVPRRAFLRAVITVGFQRLPEMFFFGWRGLLNRFGIAISAMSFLENRSGNLCVSGAFANLDMSEKAASSYWYGMAFAKLVSESELSVPWLGHVDRMRASGALTTTSSSNERGDLVGRDRNSRWHVLEAKGRSNSYPQSLIDTAKQQAANVTTINNQPPRTTSACVTSLFSSPVSILLDDPKPKRRDGRRWRIAEDLFFRAYYRGVIEYIREHGGRQQRAPEGTFMVAPLFPYLWEIPPMRPRYWQDWRLELGLLDNIYESPSKAPSATEGLARTNDTETRDADAGKVGPDGIAIFGRMPDWEESHAR